MREAAYLLGLLATAAIVYALVVLLPSKLKTRELQARHDALVTDVAVLEESIATLNREAKSLHDDPWTVERALRGRLGYLRPGERVFRAGD